MKNFEKWTELCKKIENKRPNFHFKEREIRWCNFGLNIGRETDGKSNNFSRPILIIKKINGELFWGVPLTTKYNGEYYKFCIGKINGKYNYVLIDQIKTFSNKRLEEKIVDLNIKTFNQIRRIIWLI